MTVRVLHCTTISTTLRAFLTPYARHFAALGYELDAAASGSSACPQCGAAFSRVFEISWSRHPLRLRNYFAMRRLRRIVAERRYRLVHVHTPVAAFLARLALRQERKRGQLSIIYTAHGFHFRRGAGLIQNLLYLLLEKIAGRWTDYLVVINREDEEAARRYRLVPAGRVRYMPGIGVDTRFYSPEMVSSAGAGERRRELHLAPDNPLLLMIADFSPGKRHRDTIRAFARLTCQQAHLAFAGDGPEMEAMRRLAHQTGVAGRVHFLGVRHDIRELIRASAATILPSGREGLPRSVMESLCLEVPVIGTDIRGIRDLLASNPADSAKPQNGVFRRGDCGLLIPVGDVDALAQAMDWILCHPADALRMGQTGRTKMAACDIEHLLGLHEQLYAEALAGQSSRERIPSPRSAMRDWYRSAGKRTIDVAVSAIFLLALLPLILLIALAIRLTMGRPILFRQPRPGREEQTFTMLKFRTMNDARNPAGELLPDAARVTRLGKLLRATSLDELPELWHVFKGEMSLVGPRPLLVEYLPYYSADERRRHSVRPGITGLAQTSGRNQTTWNERLRQDLFYVDHCSLTLDCRILFRTLAAVLHGDGGTGAIEKLGRFRGTAPL